MERVQWMNEIHNSWKEKKMSFSYATRQCKEYVKFKIEKIDCGNKVKPIFENKYIMFMTFYRAKSK